MTIINQFGGKIIEIAPKILNTSYANHRNKRVLFKPDVKKTLNKLDAGPGINSKNNHPRNKTKILKDDVSTRTRSKSSQVDQNVGITTRSKVKGTCNLSV